MDPLIVRRTLQVITGILLGLAVVSVVVFGLPWPGADRSPVGFGIQGPSLTPDTPPGAFFLDDPYPAPAFSLETPDGRTLTETALEGAVSVVFFGFASCPDVCPITLGNLSRALELLEDEAGPAVQGFFVSVDPQRDTPEVLDRYMERFHPAITALTGPEDEVRRVARDWGIYVATVELAEGAPDPHEGHDHAAHVPDAPDPDELPFADDAGDYTVDHTARSLVVDPRGRVAGTLAPSLTPDEIAEALRPLLDP